MVIGAMKAKYFDDAAGCVAVVLIREEIEYLEKLYVFQNCWGFVR